MNDRGLIVALQKKAGQSNFCFVPLSEKCAWSANTWYLKSLEDFVFITFPEPKT